MGKKFYFGTPAFEDILYVGPVVICDFLGFSQGSVKDTSPCYSASVYAGQNKSRTSRFVISF